MKKKSVFISPLNDVVFSHVFGDQRNIQNTRNFLSALLKIPKEDYEHLTVKNSVMKPASVHGKTSIVDILLQTKSGRFIQIELQVEKESNFRGRILHYAAQIFSRQLRKGSNYGKLHQVISIVICDHILLEDEDNYFNVFELRNARNKLFTDLLQVVILELPKVPETEDSPLWPWLKFLKCENMEECKMLAKRHPELKKAADNVIHFSFWDRLEWTMILRERRRREYLQMKADIREEAIAEGLAEGKAKGLAEGKAEGNAEGHVNEKFEIARKMKEMNYPISQITEITGLSVIEIEKI